MIETDWIATEELIEIAMNAIEETTVAEVVVEAAR